jgi:hypothetical protein
MLARRFTRQSYKADTKSEQTRSRCRARTEILRDLVAGARALLGFEIELPGSMARAARLDGSGDALDAVLCACQAAWAYARRRQRFGVPPSADPLEGWIVGPPPSRLRR